MRAGAAISGGMGAGFTNRIKGWARTVKRDLGALWLAARDPRVPWTAKALAGLVVAYAASPIDLIPDAIPVLGLLDDAILVPIGIALAVRLIPPELMAELRLAAETAPPRPRSMAAAIAIGAAWLGTVLLTGWYLLG